MHRNKVFPEGAEHEVAETNISYVESEIGLLDNEIAHMQQSLGALQQRRDTLRQFRALLSPIRKLPAELLQQIFTQSQLNSRYILVWSKSKPQPFVQIVTQVSSYWRTVAYSCPRLWSNIIMNLDDPLSPAKKPMIAPFIEKCISLSNGVPLRISLEGRCTTDILDVNCIAAIAKSAHMWEVFEVCNGMLLRAIDSQLSENTVFTHLQSLKLSGVAHWISLKPAPKLIRLEVSKSNDLNCSKSRITLPSESSLSSLFLPTIASPLRLFQNFPWSQITSFSSTFNLFAKDELYTILRSMPSLIFLHLDGPTNTCKSIVLSNLEKLEVGGCWSSKDIFNVLTTPNLRILHTLSDCEAINSKVWQEFVDRSCCFLEEIKLIGTYIDNILHSQELKTIKRLQLHLSSHVMIVEYLKKLTRDHSADACTLFPQLEVLDIAHISAKVGVTKALINMIRSRLPPIRAEMVNVTNFPMLEDNTEEMRYIKSVNVLFADMLPDGDVEAFKEFLQSDVVQLSQAEIIINIKDRTLSSAIACRM
ncbi:hypothetical protein BDQ17DRAFT_1425161 [Cyathus striatus]|nr:hypothetical protein BDQ17DRAFT_1425161 [Cyathus striatus]